MWPQAGRAKWQQLPLDRTQGLPAILHPRLHPADTLYLSLCSLGVLRLCSDHCPEGPSLSHPWRGPLYPTRPSPLQLSWVGRVRGLPWPHATALIQAPPPSLSCLISARQKRRSKCEPCQEQRKYAGNHTLPISPPQPNFSCDVSRCVWDGRQLGETNLEHSCK